MAKTGTVDVDILTGKPLELVRDEQAAKAKSQTEAGLKERMEFLNLSQTADGKKLLSIIEKKLLARIRELVNADPEAQAYAALLKDLGIKEALAERALQDYLAFNKHIERDS